MLILYDMYKLTILTTSLPVAILYRVRDNKRKAYASTKDEEMDVLSSVSACMRWR